MVRHLVVGVLAAVPLVRERPEPPKGWLCGNDPKTPPDHRADAPA
jgi:hypothetical protein